MVPAVEDSVAAVSLVHTLVPTGAGKLIGCTGELLRWANKNHVVIIMIIIIIIHLLLCQVFIQGSFCGILK